MHAVTFAPSDSCFYAESKLRQSLTVLLQWQEQAHPCCTQTSEGFRSSSAPTRLWL